MGNLGLRDPGDVTAGGLCGKKGEGGGEPRACRLAVAVSLAFCTLFATAAAYAQETATQHSTASAATAPAREDALAEILVTGTRIARRDYSSDSPIVTVDQSALLAAGQPTLDRALGQLPQFAAAQGASEVGDVQAGTGFYGGQSYGDLRGLGCDCRRDQL
jgi:iron complex outermembrane receptor protein